MPVVMQGEVVPIQEGEEFEPEGRDITPRPLFTEMMELRRMDEVGVAWKEVAR